MTNKKVAEHVFARNPKIQEVFITSDQHAFEKDSQAAEHAKTLKDHKVVKIGRKETDKEIDVTRKA